MLGVSKCLNPSPHTVVYDVSQCYHHRRVKYLIQDSGLQPGDLTHTFASAVRDEFNSDVLGWLESSDLSEGRGLYIYASPTPENPAGTGTGKTYCLHALAVKALNQCRSVRFFTSSELINWYRKCAQDNDPSENEELASYDFLCWDDIGKECTASEWTEGKIFNLINLRYRYRRPIAFSSNCKSEGLAQRLRPRHGSACVSRMREMC